MKKGGAPSKSTRMKSILFRCCKKMFKNTLGYFGIKEKEAR